SPIRLGIRALLDACERPGGVLPEELVLVVEVALDGRPLRLAADVAGGDECIPTQPAAVVARDVQAGVTGAQLRRVVGEPVDEHAVAPAETAAERVQLLPQLGVRIEPRVARQPSVPRWALRLGGVVAERGRDDRSGAGKQRLRMARLLRVRHREAHVGEQAALATLANVPLRL